MKGLEHARKYLENVYDTIANAIDGTVLETVLHQLRKVLEEARFMTHPGASSHPKFAQWATVREMVEDAMQVRWETPDELHQRRRHPQRVGTSQPNPPSR